MSQLCPTDINCVAKNSVGGRILYTSTKQKSIQQAFVFAISHKMEIHILHYLSNRISDVRQPRICGAFEIWQCLKRCARLVVFLVSMNGLLQSGSVEHRIRISI